MKQTIYIIRHGITEGNEKGWYYGHLDIPITKRGERELKKNKENNIYPDFSEFKKFTSGLKRTILTLDILAPNSKFEIIEDLKEFNFGVFEGKTPEVLKTDPLFDSWLKDNNYIIPKGESSNMFIERVIKGYKTLVSKSGDKKLLVCHGAVISVIMSYLFEEDDNRNIFKWIPAPSRGYVLNVSKEITYEEV